MTHKRPETRDEIRQVPFYSQFSDEQIKRQVKANAEGLRKMEARALQTGKKVGGFTADQLSEMAVHYEKLAK